MNEEPLKVPSPESTGGGGTSYEQHVNAFALALLLVRGIPPILTDCELIEVHSQTKHRGWKTDDVLLVGANGQGNTRKLAAQVKLGFTVSSKDAECVETIAGLWNDFRNPSLFERGHDTLGIIVLHGTTTLLTHFNAMLDCARASLDAKDFAHRLVPNNYPHRTTRKYAEDIRAIVSAGKDGPPTAEEFLAFLRHLHVLSLDLGTSSACTEAGIKSLLKQTATQADKLGTAQSTWNALFRLAAVGMHAATSHTRDTLPDELRQRHSVLDGAIHDSLTTLRNHGSVVTDAIRDRIGDSVHLRRDELMQELRERLEDAQVVIVTGPAGSGKSGLAKRVCKELGEEHFVFAFRAEEFAVAHIDQTLQHAHVGQDAIALQSVLSGQERKLLLVESVERLLEASVRDGFTDLLLLVGKDPSWRLVLTCRDYSLETVRSSLIERTGVSYTVLSARPLTNEDLKQVAEQIPSLQRPLANPSLRDLFRSPYILDRAAQMNWPADVTLPEGERSFRRLFWADVVRCDGEARHGLPLRREKAFIEMAVRRARSLKPFVDCSNIDQEALLHLRQRDVVIFHGQTGSICAPAHDVLEDWAVIQWLEQQFLLACGNANQLATEIGGAPALRRGFRKWLGELLEFERESADRFVNSVMTDNTLPGQFRDDTIVSALLSSTASQFLVRHCAELVSNDYAQLLRVVHLLRIACVKTPRWLPEGQQLTPGFVAPAGQVWVNVIELVEQELGKLLPTHLSTILGLIEDWTRGVTWWTPEPAGKSAVARIAFALLSRLGGYDSDDARKRVLEIIAKVPTGAPEKLLGLMLRAEQRGKHDRNAQEFSELILTGMSGVFACRFFPDAVISLTRTALCQSEESLVDPNEYVGATELEPVFGLDSSRSDFFPPSSWRGPFLQLLRWHSEKGVALIVELLNHAAEWYGKRKWPRIRLEDAWEITIRIPGHGERKQWANGRLWCLHRGTSVGPYVLQTALMALETWLLEQCEESGFDLESWLLQLLAESNNVAVTAVVASLSNAYTHRAGRAALALLSCRELFDFDRERMVVESSAASLASGMGILGVSQGLYEQERRLANAKAHRRRDLEVLALNLQLGKHQSAVQDLIDEHRAALPEKRRQTRRDKLWRLALHRMDLRGYEPGDVALAPQPTTSPSVGANTDGGTQPVYMRLKEPDRDIQSMLNKLAPASEKSNAELALLMWAVGAWRGEKGTGYETISWREQLNVAQERASATGTERDLGRRGPSYVAAVCARDHWDELTIGDRDWCLNTLILEIERQCDSDDYLVGCSHNPMDSSRPAAYVLPAILARRDANEDISRILSAIAKTLTHTSTEVRQYAAEGVSAYLSDRRNDILMQCVGGLAIKAALLNDLDRAEKEKEYDQRLHPEVRIKMVVPHVRAAIEAGNSNSEQILATLDLGSWPARDVLGLILTMLRRRPGDRSAVEIHRRVARHLAAIWARDRRHGGERRQRDFHREHEWLDRISRFALRMPAQQAVALCDSLLDAVSTNPREASTFISDLIVAEDQAEETTSFWPIWGASADRLETAPWLQQIDDRYAPDDGLVHKMFLGLEWKKGVHHWRKLEGNAQRIDGLFERLPPSMRVLESYCSFLYSIGTRSLPQAFVIIAKRLQQGSPSVMLAKANTRFILESLLGQFVYGKPREVKSDTRLRDSVLFLLDQLVESGSSHAYRMRDDFVTPLA